MKRFLCYLLIASILIVSCVGCNKETKETDKKETKVEKTDTQEEVSDNKQETENEVVTDTKESSTSNETSSNTKNQTSTKQENTKSTTTKQSTSQSNKEETTQNNSSKHKHTYSKSVTKPTCTDQGYTTYTCSCGDNYKNDFTAAKGHTEVVDEAVIATTTSTGLTQGIHCSVCGMVFVKQEVIPVANIYIKSIDFEQQGQTLSAGDTITTIVYVDSKSYNITEVWACYDCDDYVENANIGFGTSVVETRSDGVYRIKYTLHNDIQPGLWYLEYCCARNSINQCENSKFYNSDNCLFYFYVQ